MANISKAIKDDFYLIKQVDDIRHKIDKFLDTEQGQIYLEDEKKADWFTRKMAKNLFNEEAKRLRKLGKQKTWEYQFYKYEQAKKRYYGNKNK